MVSAGIGTMKKVNQTGRKRNMGFMKLLRKLPAGRPAAFGLAVCLAASLMAGCKGKGDDGKEAASVPLPGQEVPVNIGKDQGESSEAMGRYIETAMELPGEAENDRYISFFQGRDRALELYTAAREGADKLGEVRRFLWQGDGWKQDEGWWDRVKPHEPSVEIRRVFYGLDGKYYFSAMGQEEYIYHLYQIQEEGESAELLAELFLPGEGQNYGLIPPKAEVDRDGRILIYGMNEATLYQPDGKKLFSMEKSWSGTSENSVGYMTGEEFVTKADKGIVRYRLSDGQKIQEIPFELGEGLLSEESLVLFGDGDGGIYGANERGLAHVGEGGSLWELLIDGSLNTMGMRSIYLQEFFQGEEKDYYGLFVEEGGAGFQIFHYTYDPDAMAAPPMTLTVYSLKDNSTARQAAALFQKSHPEVRVEVLSGVEENKTPSEEMIRALNTELLSGKGADVLVLDGLPWKSYEEKGILADLSETFGEIQKEDPLMDQVLAGFTKEDGSIYQMPARICVPVLIGTEAERAAFDSMEAMAAYEGEKPLMAAETYENLLILMANLQYPQLFGGGKDDISEELLARYLEAVRSLGEKNGSRTVFTEEEMEQLWISNHRVPNGIRGTAIKFDYGTAACGVENMAGLYDLIIPDAILQKHPEASMESINKIYFPGTLIGVNQGSDKTELAREFVRCVFSEEVQKEEFFDGFPVNLRAQEYNCVSSGRDNISVGSGIGDYHISGGYPNTEKRRELYRIIGGVSVPVMVDDTVMNMIVNGARDYFEGKATAEQAASAICRQLALYRAEQE